MIAKRRKNAVIIVAVVLLVALNVWRWWPSMPHSFGGTNQTSTASRLEDFEVKALPVEVATRLERDIFHPRRPVVKPKPVAKAVPKAPEPPPKSPEELAHDAAQAAFAQIHCVGISVRDKRIQAYLINGGEATLVSAGDKVSGRFVIEKIVPDEVTLRDPETGVGGKLGVSGK